MVQGPLLDLLVHVKTLKFRYHFPMEIHLSNIHFRIKLCNLAQANISSACVLYGNGGANGGSKGGRGGAAAPPIAGRRGQIFFFLIRTKITSFWS